jgi:hypothetical protein
MTQSLHLTLESGNADVHVPTILRELAEKIEYGREGYFTLVDTNGQGVGRAFYEIWENDDDTL